MIEKLEKHLKIAMDKSLAGVRDTNSLIEKTAWSYAYDLMLDFSDFLLRHRGYIGKPVYAVKRRLWFISVEDYDKAQAEGVSFDVDFEVDGLLNFDEFDYKQFLIEFKEYFINEEIERMIDSQIHGDHALMLAKIMASQIIIKTLREL